jgi:hypothetical protein
MYTFRELLDLFNLTDSTHLTEQDMKATKRAVLQMHPDKSRLPAKYFLFYQQAYQVILDFYLQQQRVSRPIPTVPMVYDTDTLSSGDRRGAIGSAGNTNAAVAVAANAKRNVSKTGPGTSIPKETTEKFQQTFNELFDKHMTNDRQQAAREVRNQWFTDAAADEAQKQQQTQATSVSAVHEHIEQYKQSQTQQALAMYRGVQDYGACGLDTHKLYNEEEGGGEEESSTSYASCDPFAKLKYEDLRKVHRDQTVFSVSGDRDIQNMKQYGSYKELEQERAGQTYAATDETESLRILSEQKRAYVERMQKLEYAAKLKNTEYESKNDAVRAHFLRLGYDMTPAASDKDTSHPIPSQTKKSCSRTKG